jgi:uncharacterized protein (DUF433 family)
MATIHGVVHGNTIELSEAPGLPDGQRVVVQLQPMEEPSAEGAEGGDRAVAAVPRQPVDEPPPEWLEHFTVDEAIAPAKIIVKGTRLLAEDLAKLVEEGRSDDDLRRLHPELTARDVDALHHYVKVPAAMRRLFGAWADEAEELDAFLEERRQQRRIHRPEIEG